MRELIYLSERKLQQFTLDRRRHWWHRVGLEGEVKLPALGGVRISRSADDSTRKADLDQVIAALERSDRAARWYTEDGLQPGQWVHFEARLNYRVMDEDNFLSTVIFIDHPRGNDVDARVRLRVPSRSSCG